MIFIKLLGFDGYRYMTFFIIGSGAIGITLGARLSSSGFPCAMVGHNRYIKRVMDGKIPVIFDGDFHHVSIEFIKSVDDLEVNNGDVLIIAVKTYSISSLLQQLLTNVNRNSPILCLQNGIDSDLHFARYFPNTMGAVVHLSCTLQPNMVVRQTINNGIGIGCISCSTKEIASFLCETLETSGIPSWIENNLMAQKRTKLLINATGAIMALHNVSIEEAFLDDYIHAKIRSIAFESAAILANLYRDENDMLGLKNLYETLERIQSGDLIQISQEEFCNRKIQGLLSYPSIWQDLEYQRGQTEIDSLNGKILELAKLFGKPAPINEQVVALIKKAQSKYLKPSELVCNKNFSLSM